MATGRARSGASNEDAKGDMGRSTADYCAARSFSAALSLARRVAHARMNAPLLATAGGRDFTALTKRGTLKGGRGADIRLVWWVEFMA